MDLPNQQFSCTLCGECCSGDMRVFLNPHDLQKMRDYLGLRTNQELLEQNYIVLGKAQWGLLLPGIRFKRTQGLQFCPFLTNHLDDSGHYRGLCFLHPHKKPLVCALAPYARELDMDTRQSRFYFQEPIKNCPGCKSLELYGLTELFPQVEAELQMEEEYLLRLRESIKNQHSNQEILKNHFGLTLAD
ncbi:MAG: YkgJ family cysteine cluster protein [Spirochaetaceae bacterium]|jgi:Fe-S-cluster containining protein|nr:YkgJ family cysteine cluster protein [Spirochaetaceae bacterium]